VLGVIIIIIIIIIIVIMIIIIIVIIMIGEHPELGQVRDAVGVLVVQGQVRHGEVRQGGAQDYGVPVVRSFCCSPSVRVYVSYQGLDGGLPLLTCRPRALCDRRRV
jgi:hypothetical protein